MTGGEDEVEGGYVVADEAGVTESQFVATEDEVLIEGVVGTFEEDEEEK